MWYSIPQMWYRKKIFFWIWKKKFMPKIQEFEVLLKSERKILRFTLENFFPKNYIILPVFYTTYVV